MLNLTWHYFIFILELFVSTFRSDQPHLALTRPRLASIKIVLCARNHILSKHVDSCLGN